MAPQPQKTMHEIEQVLPKADPRWAALHRIIKQKSYMEGDFILSSGRHSKYLFQLRQTTMHPEGAALIGGIVVDYMKRFGLTCVGGLELGAVPMVTAISVESHHKNFPVSAFFVRKQAKAHGAREQIDGYFDPAGATLLVDDVATTGGSIAKALEALRLAHGTVQVSRALVVVDREEGAVENLAAQGITLASIFKRSDFFSP